MSESEPNELANSKWIAYELHDGLLQWVVSARMQVQGLASRIEDCDIDAIRDQLGSVESALATSIEEGRQLISYLEQKSFDGEVENRLGTEMALFVDLKQSEKAQPQLELLTKEEEWPRLSPYLEWNVIRILQQAITNAIQHAKSERVSIKAAEDEKRFEFVVEDNGIGFDASRAESLVNHFGVSSMKHRAMTIGAQLDIETEQGSGTVIRLRFKKAP